MDGTQPTSAVNTTISTFLQNFPKESSEQKFRYSDYELNFIFKPHIEEKLVKAREDYESYKTSFQNLNDVADTSPVFKISEEGSNTVLKEETTRLAQRQAKFIDCLEAALKRIENKTYGICRETGQLIPKERLWAVPHATLSIEAKKENKALQKGARR